jgi:hypothetical protein
MVGDEDRDVANQFDIPFICILLHCFPLTVITPLRELMKVDIFPQLICISFQRGRFPVDEIMIPRNPSLAAVMLVECLKERILIQP